MVADTPLHQAACAKLLELAEVYARHRQPAPALLDTPPPDVAAFMAAVRLGQAATVYPLQVDREAWSKSKFAGSASGWLVVSSGCAWLTTDSRLVDEIYDAHFAMEMAKAKVSTRRRGTL